MSDRDQLISVLGRIAQALETGNRIAVEAHKFDIACKTSDQLTDCGDDPETAFHISEVSFATLDALDALVKP